MTDRTYSTPSTDPVPTERPAKLIITRGLPGSGKTTWVMNQVRRHQDTRARIGRDFLRLGMHGGALYTAETESQVTRVEFAAVEGLLRLGVEVYVDDTNLPAKYARWWSDLAVDLGVPFRVQDFRDVPLDVCLDRDRGRFGTGGHVGERVIRDMHERYLTDHTPAGDRGDAGE